jgi:hypothetical protein
VARQEILDRIQKYVDPFRITKGEGFRLKDFDPGDTRQRLQIWMSPGTRLLTQSTVTTPQRKPFRWCAKAAPRC